MNTEQKKNTGNDTTVGSHTRNAQHVIDAEKAYLGITDNEEVRGLAISGGGIRSASFGLGVMQSLVANNQMERMTYMSTVSGGGYLGSALTWALAQDQHAGTSPDNFPLGKREKPGSGKKAAEGPDTKNQLLNFIRLHSSYLIPTGQLGIVSFTGVVMRSIFISLSVYFSLLVIALSMLKLIGVFRSNSWLYWLEKHCPIIPTTGVLPFFTLVLGAVFILLSYLYSLRTRRLKESTKFSDYSNFIRGQKALGFILKAAAGSLLLGLLPYLANFEERIEAAWTASGATVFGTLVGLWQYIRAQQKETNGGGLPTAVIYLGAFGLLYGLIVLAYLASGLFFNDKGFDTERIGWFIAFILFSLTLSMAVNLNLVGPHRIWRNRLMEAFMPNKEAVEKNTWQPATEADSGHMENMCGKKPYHLVNTNIILTNSDQVKFRGRGGDNFIFSRLYSGSSATGWKTTSTLQQQKGRKITLATAMATSAAAVNPNAGVSGGGVTRNVVVSVLLSLLNLRLGYWTTNPLKTEKFLPPNFIKPGLSYELMRKGYNEAVTRIMLTDGGHFENVATYELIRRQLRVIVVSDGGADPLFNFDDLANLVEKARVDFGTKINFRKGFDLGDMLPGTSGDSDFQKKYEIAKNGFAVADILYRDGSTGILFYVKLAMIEGLPTDVYSYKGVNPAFPHQSTSDQFFDEKQFEAYRELGYNAGWKMMESAPAEQFFNIPDFVYSRQKMGKD